MGHKPLTRFVAEEENGKRELFHVRELSDDTLIVTLRVEKQSLKQLTPVDVTEARFTIHLSADSIYKGTTINHHTKDASGETACHSSFVENSHEHLLFPVMTRRCSKLTHSRYYHNPHQKDTVVTISDRFSKNSTLVFHLYVSRKGYDFPIVEPYSLVQKEFKTFKFGVYSCFENFPACDIGGYAVFRSSPSKISGKFDGERFSNGFSNVSPNEIASLNKSNMDLLSLNFAAHLMDILKPNKEEMNTILNHPVYYSTYPFEENQPVLKLADPDQITDLPSIIPLDKTD